MAFLTFRVDARAVTEGLRAYPPRAVADCKVVMRNSGFRLLDRINLIVPIDTKYMHDHTTVVIASDDLAYEAGWWASDFEGTVTEDGRPRPFYPPWVEFPTSKAAAQPSLRPAFADEQPVLIQELRAALAGAGGRAR